MIGKVLYSAVCFAVCLALLAACAPMLALPSAVTSQTTRESMTPVVIPEPVATAAAGVLPPGEVFKRISPSVAFIETPLDFGSGFVGEGGYLITNAHVVWPFDKARVVFPDGSEHKDVWVLAWDLLADLAILGPLETELPPLTLADGETLPIGSDVYLVGYPGEVEKLPQPTITRGVLSRHREWEAAGLTYLQSDATIIGGQSGGVLVSDAGQVIGISGLGWPWPNFQSPGLSFALVASAADLAPRIARLIAGEDVSGLGNRHWQFEDGATEQAILLDNQRHARFFLLQEPQDTEVQIDLSGGDEFLASARDMQGLILDGIKHDTELTSTLSITVPDEQPVLLEVRSLSDSPMDVSLTSSSMLYPQDDPDDGKVLARNETVAGNMDYPGDVDYCPIYLTAGDEVEVVVESMLMGPTLSVDYRGAPPEAMASSEKSVGIFDNGESLIYAAPHTGRYFITVEGASGMDTLGYLLHVKDVPPEETATPPPAAIDTSLDATTSWYRSAQGSFRIRYPLDWQPQPATPGVTAAFASEAGGALEIVEQDLVSLGMGKIAESDYVDQVIRRLEATSPDFKLSSLKPFETGSGLTGEVITYTDLGSARRCSSLLHVEQGRYAFSATYCAGASRYRELKPLIDGSYRSFAVEESQ